MLDKLPRKSRVALLKKQSATLDTKARIDLYHQISQLMYDQVLYIGIWKDPDLWSINSHLQNVKLSGETKAIFAAKKTPAAPAQAEPGALPCKREGRSPADSGGSARDNDDLRPVPCAHLDLQLCPRLLYY